MRQGLGRSAWWKALGGVLLAAAAGCNACDVVGLEGETSSSSGSPGACVAEANTCSDARESFRDGRCQSTFCESDAECCPGTKCDLSFNLCRTRLNDLTCMVDTDCMQKGQKCVLQASGARACVYQSCTTTAGCEPGLSCFEGWCVGGSPCPEGCGAGNVCDVATGSCHPAVERTGCDEPCQPGQLRVLTDPVNMRGDTCCAWECECVELPPLVPGVQGFWASVAAGRLEVAVANHDATYGDLVVTRYTRDGAYITTTYVDGFPLTGTLGGAANGPRRGITEPGDVVGEYASAAADPMGRIHVAYYDRTNGALKYAVNTEGPIWVTMTVDDADDAGRYASITIRPSDGVPVISYLVLGTNGVGRSISRVKVAEASGPNPRVATDWTLRVVEEAPAYDACNGACTTAQVCTVGESGPRCAAPATACSPGCSSAQACVAVTGGAECQALGNPPILDVPRVVGQGTAVASHEDRVVIAYHDAVNGLVKAATLRAGMVGTPVIVDGDGMNGRNAGDVGSFIDVALDLNGKVAMVYWNSSRNDLVFYDGSDLQGGRFHVVDTGRGSPPGFGYLGADASLEFGPDGTAYVVYQQQDTLDLVMAQRDPAGNWSSESLVPGANNGALGFFATMTVSGTRAYVASVKAELDAANTVANKLGLQVVDVPMN